MLNKKIKLLFSFFLMLLICNETFPQNRLSSPYSRFGFGEMSRRTSYTNQSMGGVSNAYQHSTTVNFSNPASYIAFDSLSCLIDAAFSFKYHILQEASLSQKGSTITFDYLSLGFSVVQYWKTAIGFQPYSFINYSINENNIYRDSVDVNYAYIGTGGIYEFYWGNAFQLFKNFSLGCNISYLFGNYDKIQKIQFSDNTFLNFKNNHNVYVNGMLFSLGAQYFIPVKKSKIGMGIVYTPSIPTIYGNQSILKLSYLNGTSGESIVDSLYWKGKEKMKITLPQTIGGGISFSSEKYFIGFDFSWSDWSNFKMGEIKDTMRDSYKYSLGGNFTPNPLSSKYFPKIMFSLGAFYELTSLYIKENQIDRFGINFGMSFPMKKNKTRFNVNAEYGQWGTLNNKLLQESYFIVSFNIKLHERWYQRRKLD